MSYNGNVDNKEKTHFLKKKNIKSIAYIYTIYYNILILFNLI